MWQKCHRESSVEWSERQITLNGNGSVRNANVLDWRRFKSTCVILNSKCWKLSERQKIPVTSSQNEMHALFVSFKPNSWCEYTLRYWLHEGRDINKSFIVCNSNAPRLSTTGFNLIKVFQPLFFIIVYTVGHFKFWKYIYQIYMFIVWRHFLTQSHLILRNSLQNSLFKWIAFWKKKKSHSNRERQKKNCLFILFL